MHDDARLPSDDSGQLLVGEPESIGHDRDEHGNNDHVHRNHAVDFVCREFDERRSVLWFDELDVRP